MFSPDSAASLPPQPKKQTWSSYIMQSSSSARLVFLPSLPTPAPGPNKMSPCVTCQAGRRFHFRIFYILPFFSLVVFLCTCSALSLSDRDIFIVGKIGDSGFLVAKCSYRPFSAAAATTTPIFLGGDSEREMSPVSLPARSRSRRVLCFSLMLGHPDLVVGPRARLSWCILKFGRGNLSNLTCQEFFFSPSKPDHRFAQDLGPSKLLGGDHVSWPHPLCLPRPSQTRIHSGIVAGGGSKSPRQPDLICLVRTKSYRRRHSEAELSLHDS